MVRAILCAPLLVTAGCLVSSNSKKEESGVKVSPQTLEQIEVGRTTAEWLVATLGRPTSRKRVEGREDQEVLRYAYTVEETSSGAVFLLFSSKSRETSKTTTFFEVTDGIVTRHWTDS